MKVNPQVNLRWNRDIPVIELIGDFTDAIEEDLINAYQTACQSDSQNIIIKFDGDSEIRSSGISVLIGLIGLAKAKTQKFYAVGLSEHFVEVFELTGLTTFIQILESEKEALSIVAL